MKQLANRAAAHLMRGRPAEALFDCEAALKVRRCLPGCVQSAHAAMQLVRESLHSQSACLEICYKMLGCAVSLMHSRFAILEEAKGRPDLLLL